MIAGKGVLMCSVAAIVLGWSAMGSAAFAQCGVASWYHGAKRTHGGTDGLTAAHRTLPFGTRVRVKNQTNGREVMVRINDRGPFIHGRVIDVSQPASKALGMGGLAKVCVSVITDQDEKASDKGGWSTEMVPLPVRAPRDRPIAEAAPNDG